MICCADISDLGRRDANNTASALNLSQLKHGDSIQLRPLLEEVRDMLSSMARNNAVRAEFDVPDPLYIAADGRALRQVLLNIISNAIKYNVPEGRVVISVKSQKFNTIMLRIQDTGVGLPAAALENCTKPFTRYSNGEGAGLGLSIASHLISLLGGTISLQSDLGIGTSVDVTLMQGTPQIMVDPDLKANAG